MQFSIFTNVSSRLAWGDHRTKITAHKKKISQHSIQSEFDLHERYKIEVKEGKKIQIGEKVLIFYVSRIYRKNDSCKSILCKAWISSLFPNEICNCKKFFFNSFPLQNLFHTTNEWGIVLWSIQKSFKKKSRTLTGTLTQKIIV